jgi:hypothetical protein
LLVLLDRFGEIASLELLVRRREVGIFLWLALLRLG